MTCSLNQGTVRSPEAAPALEPVQHSFPHQSERLCGLSRAFGDGEVVEAGGRFRGRPEEVRCVFLHLEEAGRGKLYEANRQGAGANRLPPHRDPANVAIGPFCGLAWLAHVASGPV